MELGETIEITSPEYPNYTDAAVCEWQLRPPTMASFSLEFLNFRLPSTDTRGGNLSEVLCFLRGCVVSSIGRNVLVIAVPEKSWEVFSRLANLGKGSWNIRITIGLPADHYEVSCPKQAHALDGNCKTGWEENICILFKQKGQFGRTKPLGKLAHGYTFLALSGNIELLQYAPPLELLPSMNTRK